MRRKEYCTSSSSSMSNNLSMVIDVRIDEILRFGGSGHWGERALFPIKIRGMRGLQSEFPSGEEFFFVEVMAIFKGHIDEATHQAPKEASGKGEQGQGEGGSGFDMERSLGEHEDEEVFPDTEAAGSDGDGGDANDHGHDGEEGC